MDLVCLSHLRWNFVYQRPQHILSRFAKKYRTFYVEEPLPSDKEDGYNIDLTDDGVWVVVPQLKHDDHGDVTARLRNIINSFFSKEKIGKHILWYYTPMALPYTSHLKPELTIYDCMDELSCFKFAPPVLKELEKDLLKKAHLVFTGGHTLYQAKKSFHNNIHPFPSSIDKLHFAKARKIQNEPEDQANVPPKRIGFYGVLDERFDINLVAEAAKYRPDWQFVFLGPVVKIDPAILPRTANTHYLGNKSYQELPAYLSGWDIALIPFALNESTRFISPTKTPEYLAAGKPVISTAINDVVNPYGHKGLVHIVHSPRELVDTADQIFQSPPGAEWLSEVDEFLQNNSWDNTWENMHELMMNELMGKKQFTTKKMDQYV